MIKTYNRYLTNGFLLSDGTFLEVLSYGTGGEFSLQLMVCLKLEYQKIKLIVYVVL